MDSLNYGRIELDQCPGCEGMWFDQGELQQVSNLMDDCARAFKVDPWEEIRKMSVTIGARQCPRCRAPMGVVCYPHPRLEVDVCLLCAGVWLDADELNKILQYIDDQMSPHETRTRDDAEAAAPEPARAPAATAQASAPAQQPRRDVSNVLGFVQQSVWDNMPKIREKGREEP